MSASPATVSRPAPAPAAATVPGHRCRLCGAPLERVVADLGPQPLCESYVRPEAYWEMEPFWVVRAYVCATCFLVQVPPLVGGEAIYRHYAYFSSYADSWVDHARRFVETAIARLELGPRSRIVEVASNDGYLLRHAMDAGIPCFGIEPAENVAAAARAIGIPTRTEFLGAETARRIVAEEGRADLLVANNVIGHVPDPGDFVAGLAILLAPGGTLTIEIPHFARTLQGNQFDQIYQEHYGYWTLLAMERALTDHGLVAFDVEELPTHGGSLRVWVRHAAGDPRPALPSVAAVRRREIEDGFADLATYEAWDARIRETRRLLLAFLFEARAAGKTVAGYGAPGKGNTLLNYCGIRPDLLAFTVDRNPFKQGSFLPGTRIPIHPPERLAEERPDYVLVLPWNLLAEIEPALAHVRAWGGRLVVPIPEPRVLP